MFNKIIQVVLFIIIIFFSCNKDKDIDEINLPDTLEVNEVNDFIYTAMNKWYLYKDNQPLLADDYFKTDIEKNEFINNGGTPEEFFNSLKIEEDDFSTLNNDVNLHSRFLTSTLGFRVDFARLNSSDLIGGVVQVFKGSNAESMGIKRGDLFNKIDGIIINTDNIQELISRSNFLLTRVFDNGRDINGDFVFQDIDELNILTENLEEHPIVISKTLTVQNTEIGYLFYKYFENEYNNDLNDEFAMFKSKGIKNFVIDLRYNSGGNELALYELASMLTGQFDGEVFLKEEYNRDIELQVISGEININTINRFRNTLSDGTSINSLELNKLYVITSDITASSSELLIQCLKPYIDVVVIGDEDGTLGKSVSKRELYDSPNFFTQDDINSNHNYFLDLVRIKGVNRDGETFAESGILPTIEGSESISNLGILGDENEKLLKLAIDDILGR